MINALVQILLLFISSLAAVLGFLVATEKGMYDGGVRLIKESGWLNAIQALRV